MSTTHNEKCSYSVAYAAMLSLMPQVPCRDDLAPLAALNFSKLMRAAEVGVYQGDFSAKNLRHWRGTYYMVDAWNYRPGDPGDKNDRRPEWHDLNYRTARLHASEAGPRAVLMRNLSTKAAQLVPDESLDWIYIDALHVERAVLMDLKAWYPKLRPGGLMSGDDWGDMKNTPLNPAARWAKKFGSVARSPGNAWGTISAVRKWAAEECLAPHVTYMHDCYAFPAWYVVKPF